MTFEGLTSRVGEGARFRVTKDADGNIWGIEIWEQDFSYSMLRGDGYWTEARRS